MDCIFFDLDIFSLAIYYIFFGHEIMPSGGPRETSSCELGRIDSGSARTNL